MKKIIAKKPQKPKSVMVYIGLPCKTDCCRYEIDWLSCNLLYRYNSKSFQNENQEIAQNYH